MSFDDIGLDTLTLWLRRIASFPGVADAFLNTLMGSLPSTFCGRLCPNNASLIAGFNRRLWCP
jgi:hypothetical protein